MRFFFALFLTMTILITDITLANDQRKNTDNSSTQKSETSSDSKVEKTDSQNTETPQKKNR